MTTQSCNVRLYSVKGNTAKHVSGTSISINAGGVADIPELFTDTLDVHSNQFVMLARSGTTAQRPTYTDVHPPKLGEVYIDTTVGDAIFYVGNNTWVNYAGTTK